MSFFEVNQVVKRFGALTAVNKVSFSLQAGEILSLVGESGSGKTTLLRMMACLIEPDAGSIELAGKNLSFFAQYLVKGHPDIRLVAQDFQLFPNISLRENIAYALRNAESTYQSERTDELLTLCGLTSIQHRLPKEVSGGEKQRTAIARALADEPLLLLLDEPFSQLDTLNKQNLKEFLLKLNVAEQTTILFVTHDLLDAFTLANRVGVMQHGNLVQMATPQEILQNPHTSYVKSIMDSLYAQYQQLVKIFE